MILEAELGEIYVSYIKPTVDKEMSDTSSNAVENRVIKKYVDGRISEVENFVTPNSDEPVGGVLKKIKMAFMHNRADASARPYCRRFIIFVI